MMTDDGVQQEEKPRRQLKRYVKRTENDERGTFDIQAVLQNEELPPSASLPTEIVPRPAVAIGQTNRAVELRRARAQARMEEFAQRTKKSAPKNVMTASWHSQTTKKVPQQQSRRERVDLLRDHGQRLAIELIQISSNLLEKLKPKKKSTEDDQHQVKQLEDLVQQLEGLQQSLLESSTNLSF